jgi:hypothetical protein
MGTLNMQNVPNERLALYVGYVHYLTLFFVIMQLAE